jgi:hypothetical protein
VTELEFIGLVSGVVADGTGTLMMQVSAGASFPDLRRLKFRFCQNLASWNYNVFNTSLIRAKSAPRLTDITIGGISVETVSFLIEFKNLKKIHFTQCLLYPETRIGLDELCTYCEIVLSNCRSLRTTAHDVVPVGGHSKKILDGIYDPTVSWDGLVQDHHPLVDSSSDV